jgi:dTDP-4-amino-4,6-dideoxygalactose transaminase
VTRIRRLYHVPSADWSGRDALLSLVGRVRVDAVERLEIASSSVIGREVVAFGSARAALAAALRVGSQAGSRVFVPAYTCVAVPNAVRTAGRDIRWVDVDGANLDLDIVATEAKPGDVVLAQLTYGIPFDAERLLALRASGLLVIEDRAHRFDADDLVGQAAIFSLEHSKVVSGGHGGLVAAQDVGVGDDLRDLRRGLPHPSRARAGRILRTSATQRLLASSRVPGPISSVGRRMALRIPFVSAESQSIDELAGAGVNLEPLEPALAEAGIRALRRMTVNRAHRRRIALRYLDRLGDLVPPWAKPVGAFVRMPIEVDDADRVTRELRRRGVDLGRRWFDAPVHPAGSQSSYEPGSAPVAERLARRVLSLPTHPLISPDDADAIAAAILAVA